MHTLRSKLAKLYGAAVAPTKPRRARPNTCARGSSCNVISSTTARRASWQGTEEWLDRRPLPARQSAHRANDALNRHAVRHQPLLHSGGMPEPIPSRCLVDVRAPISTRKGYEKIGIIGS